MDTIYVPSTATGEELISRGINPARLAVMKRGVDVHQFHPSKCIDLSGKFGIREDCIKLLYVGRVSREKNLELLSESFKQLSSVHQSVHLIVVGDGPYLETMKHGLKNYNVTFTGYLQGEELCQVYASSDLFIFPSTTDTFGNVVLEAQASGLPVIVTDCGGPKENVVDGITGVIVKTITAEEFTSSISKVVNDKSKMRKMGQAARKQMENRAFDELFKITWQESYNGEVHPLKKRTA